MRHERKHNRIGKRERFLIEILRGEDEGVTARELGKRIWQDEVTASRMAKLYQSLRSLVRKKVISEEKRIFGYGGRSYCKVFYLREHQLKKIADQKQKRGWKI